MRVSGVRGAPATDTYKVSLSYQDGWKSVGQLTVSGPEALAKGLKAGDLLRELAALAGGKGGGKPDQARGAAPDRSKLEEIKAAAKIEVGKGR